jgi:hypothetical protein
VGPDHLTVVSELGLDNVFRKPNLARRRATHLSMVPFERKVGVDACRVSLALKSDRIRRVRMPSEGLPPIERSDKTKGESATRERAAVASEET